MIYVALYSGIAMIAALVLRLFKPQANWKMILLTTVIVVIGHCLISAYHMYRTFDAMTVFGAEDSQTMASSISESLDHSMIAVYLIPISIGLAFGFHKLTYKPPKA